MLFTLFLFQSTIELSAQVSISGNVTSTDGEPLIGASIVVQGTSIGTVTDIDGNYEISVYFSGANLFVLSDFTLADPETSMFGRSNIALGFSEGEYPSARIITAGVKVRL